MDKKTIVAIVAVGIVLLFIIEAFALGLMAGYDETAEKEEAQAGTVIGRVAANVTVARYEPYVIVSGNNSEIARIKDKLIEEGKATYAVRSGESLIVNLKESKFAPEAAIEFERINASVLATVWVSMPSVVTVKYEGGEMEAEGRSISLRVAPVYEEGSVHEASFPARVENGRIAGVGQVVILPKIVEGAAAEAELLSKPKEKYIAEVPWEERSMAKKIAVLQNVSFTEKSFISVSKNFSSEELAAVAGKEYVTGVQVGVISVRNDFVNMTMAESDLSLFKPVFPSSFAIFENESDAMEWQENLSSENISVTVVTESELKLLLPEILEKDGKNYYVKERDLTLNVREFAGENETVNIIFDFEADGNRVIRVVKESVEIE